MISPGQEIRLGRRPTFIRPPDPNISGWCGLLQAAKPIAVALLLFALYSIYAVGATAQDSANKRILILTGYSPSSPAVQSITQSIRTTIRNGSGDSIDFLYEFQESAKVTNSEYEVDIVEYLKKKYGREKLDLVVVLGGPPLKLLMDHEAELFTHVPKVFYFHDERELVARNVWPDVTGVWATLQFTQTLDIALSLHPGTTKVAVVSGTSEADRFLTSEAQRVFKRYEERLEFIYLTDLTIGELKTRLATLPAHTVVIFLSYFSDRNGGSYSGTEALSMFGPSSNAPIYGVSKTHLGSGIVGGSLLDFEGLGKSVGQVALRVLAGEKPKEIVPQTAPNLIEFDWRQLHRWKIDEANLPQPSLVLFREPTFLKRYWNYVAIISAAVLIQAILIVWLLIVYFRQRRAEEERQRYASLAKSEHQHLDDVVSNVPGIVWETLIDPKTKETRTTFMSNYVEKLLGYTPEEWLTSAPGLGLRLMPDEDRDIARRVTERVLANGKETTTQFRWFTKDGRIVWVESYLNPILNETGQIIGMRGVTMDITDRKLSEEAKQHSDERSRAILHAVPDLMFLQTADGVYLDYHAKDPRELLLPPEEFLGKNMHDALPPGLAQQFATYFQLALDTGEPQLVEYELTLDGVLRWYEARMVASGRDVLTVVREVTQRKLMEVALQKNEAQLSGIIGSAMDGIITLDEDKRIVLFNTAAEKMFGCSARDALGEKLERFIPNAIRDSEGDQILSFASRDSGSLRIPAGELYGLTSSGKEFPLEASISQLELDGQKLFTVILRDITQRKLAEQEIKKSEANYRSIFNAANDAIFVHDANTGEILDANQRMCELYGYSVEEVRNLTIADLTFNGSSASQQAALKWVTRAAAGENQLFEWNAKNSTGQQFFVEVGLRYTPIGDRECVLAVVRDITERKQAVDELRQSEARFGKAFRANPQPMSITTIVGGVYVDVNDSFLAMSGYKREEVIGRSSLELEIWETPSDRANFITALEERGSLRNVEAKFRIKDGSLRVLLSSAEQMEIGGEMCLLVASSDITDRMVVQQALRESEERFRNMADTAPVMIWIADANKRVTYFNQQWLEFTGRHIEDEIGDGWADGIYTDDLAHCLDIYNTGFSQRKQFSLEYRLRRFDGDYRWVLDCGTPRFAADGKFLGYIGSCIDITERKQSEEALREAHEELSRLKNQLEAENIYLQQELHREQSFGDIVGQSDGIKYVLFKINQVAPTDTTVLISGETGTGKELVALAIHRASPRRDRALIKVNCAALSATLIESELFGHEKGAFTGAGTRKTGRFELADGGTIFLDEIGELPLESQSKLLRVIQEGELERVGGTKTVKVNVRIIAATNRNLKVEVQKGTFREDLWYRLNVFPITVPPLRQRKEDIPLMVDHFANRFSKKFGKTIKSIPVSTMQRLQLHSWPGNVRELANVIERAVIHSGGTTLSLVDTFEPLPDKPRQETQSLEDVERDYIIRTLESTGWRIEGPYGAAKILGLNPSTLRTRMAKLGIQRGRETFV